MVGPRPDHRHETISVMAAHRPDHHTSPSVMAGLDPATRPQSAQPPEKREISAIEWVAGSSPALTERGVEERAAPAHTLPPSRADNLEKPTRDETIA